MLFDSPVYIVFLTVVVLIYWRLGFRNQNRFLLAVSYFFYGWWDWRFLVLMFCSTSLDYIVAHRIHSASTERSRRAWLVFSLVANFATLGFFKYFNFFYDSFAHTLGLLGFHDVPSVLLRVILPPGISFYTFQEIAYIVDVYRRRLAPATSFVDYALFVSLFPHLIAGPIQRPSHLLPQVQNPRTWNPEAAFNGLLLILDGLFRKCVIADSCALIANSAFEGRFGPPNIPVLLLGVYAFAWQIYGDFSGYSNIARGSAQLMNFHFMVNFRQPYLAESLQDFWRRWHISLSTWLRDYLYVSLGGNRYGNLITYRNLLITMLLGGLWHGANWTFVVWGGIHGGWLALERFVSKPKAVEKYSSLKRWGRRIVIFHLVCLAWVFFRAPSLSAAWSMLSGATLWRWEPQYLVAFEFLALFSLPLFALDVFLEKTGDEYVFQGFPIQARVAVGLAALIVITLLGANQANAFIYFRF